MIDQAVATTSSSIATSLLAELEQELSTTRKFIERVPESNLRGGRTRNQ